MLKGIWNLLPAIIGTFQTALPILKEIMINVVRLVDVLPFNVEAEAVILKINEIYAKVYTWVEVLKNMFLVS